MWRAVSIATVLLVSAGAASAKPASAAAPAKVEFRMDVGARGRLAFRDGFEVPLNQEQERIEAHYPDRGGTFAAAAGRYEVWKRLTLGAGVTRFARSGAAAVQAMVPHPFFDNRFRSVDGTSGTRRQETGVNVTAGWRIPLSDDIHLDVSAGPAIVQVKQVLVTGVRITEEYPYDTATFANADLTNASRTGAGVYAAADVTWVFSKHLGAGGLVQFTHARVRLTAGDRRVSVEAGGVEAGGGVRFLF